MSSDYSQLVAGFKPQFGNANHIAALPLIAEAKRLQARLDTHKNPKRPPLALIEELKGVEKRVINLLRRGAPKSTYPLSSPQV